ncbi:MAG: SDR family NAD(P)-dependent oxidoreductase [Deltaproteobacteria bacterium]|jgi:short-subunit dehydrogenase|nr:SDR family NAD(P)-dependent oxidoreductase [Deltaproteobacteria bacterium]
MRDPRHVAITGASGGLGRALALEYARPGMALSLCGRNAESLARTAGLARGKGAECFEALFDARDAEALVGWLAVSDRRAPLDLVIANAGICRGVGPDGLEDPRDAVDTLRVNAETAILTSLCAARIMRTRGRGQIAVISSQAGRVPLTFTPAYAASKAAARSYALSLRDGLAAQGVEVTAVSPGYLRSPMQETFVGGLIRAWPAERAARRIASALRGNPREIRFPLLMNLLVWAFQFCPRFLAPPLLRSFSFRCEPPSGSGGGKPAQGAAGTAAGDPDAPGGGTSLGDGSGSGTGAEPFSG